MLGDYIDNTALRIEEFIRHKDLSINEFEKEIGVSNNSIGAAIRRKTSIKSNVLNKILIAYPEINPIWLLTGKGEMILSSEAIQKSQVLAAAKFDIKNISLVSLQTQLHMVFEKLGNFECFMEAVKLKIEIEKEMEQIKASSEKVDSTG